MNEQSLSWIAAALSESTLELFAAYGVSLTAGWPEDALADADICAATIGFTGDHLQGALVITVTEALVSASLPRQLAAADGLDMVVDWTGELANQLLGRMKKKLLGHQAAIVLSTPVVIRGRGLMSYSPHAVQSVSRNFSRGEPELKAEFQVRSEAGFELSPWSDEDAGPSEGEVSLF